MGKLSRFKRLGAPEERKDGALSRMKARISDSFEGKKSQIHAMTAARMRSDKRVLERWMQYSGVEDPSEIDYENPCVRIEYVCCEMDLLMMAIEDGQRFLDETGCDDETFMRYYDQSAEAP